MYLFHMMLKEENVPYFKGQCNEPNDLTRTTAVKTSGSRLNGRRMMLNNDKETEALSAVKTFWSSIKANVVKVRTRATINEDNRTIKAEREFRYAQVDQLTLFDLG
jgi:hypothetical protein